MSSMIQCSSTDSQDGVPSPPVKLTATHAWREMILTCGWPASHQLLVIRVFKDEDKRQELDKLVTAKDQEEGGVYCTWAAGEREL